MKTEKCALPILLAAVLLCAAPAAFRPQAQTTITFTLVPEQSPVVTTATLSYTGIKLLEKTVQKNLEGSFQLILDRASGTLHDVQVVSVDVDFAEPISFTAQKDVGGGTTAELTISLMGGAFTMTEESTATLVDGSGSATISLYEIVFSVDLQYEYTVDLPILPDITDSGIKTISHTITDPFTFTISPVSGIDPSTTLTAQFHLEDTIDENLGDGFRAQIAVSATITGKFVPPKAAVRDFYLYDRELVRLQDGAADREREMKNGHRKTENRKL